MSDELALSPARLERRAQWREALGRLFTEGGFPKVEAWQLDVAAHLLSLRPEPEASAQAQIWSETQMCASEVVAEMKADGRINKWGNWPQRDSR